jgi:agmatinase
MLLSMKIIVALAAAVAAHGDHEDQTPIAGPHKSLWYNTLPGDGGTVSQAHTGQFSKEDKSIDSSQQADSVFSGISTFGRIRQVPAELKYLDVELCRPRFDS